MSTVLCPARQNNFGNKPFQANSSKKKLSNKLTQKIQITIITTYTQT